MEPADLTSLVAAVLAPADAAVVGPLLLASYGDAEPGIRAHGGYVVTRSPASIRVSVVWWP